MQRLMCGSKYNAWLCTREPGHEGKHQSDGVTWANHEAKRDEGAENRMHRAGSEKLPSISEFFTDPNQPRRML